jgi:hypothetical protein
VLRGTGEGDPAVPSATDPPAIGPAAGYDQDDLARDLGIHPADRALPRAVSAYAGAFTEAFWQETSGPAATTPARTTARSQSRYPAKSSTRQKASRKKRIRQYRDTAGK